MQKNLRSAALISNLTLSLLYSLLILGSTAPHALAAATVWPINLHFHNDSSNPLAGGFIRTTSTLNTTQAWRSHPQGFINFTGRLQRDFYLHPDLAGSFTINGTIWLHPWLVGSGTGGSVAKGSFTAAIYDVSPSGQFAAGSSSSSGSLDIPYGNSAAQSADVNSIPGNAPLKFSLAAYTFQPGHSILVHLEMLPQGAGTVLSFYYDSQTTPSYVTLYSQDIVSVVNTWTTDAVGSPKNGFPATTANLQVDMLANITDPLGGYDVNASALGAAYARVTLSLMSPYGAQLLLGQRMNLLSGGELSFQNLFRLNYTIGSPSQGQYSFTVTATDNTGNVVIGSGFFQVTTGSPGSPVTSTAAIQLVSLALLLIAVAGIVAYAARRKGKSKPASPSSAPQVTAS